MSQRPAAAHQGLITLPSGLPTADPTRFLSSLERLWGWPPGVHRVISRPAANGFSPRGKALGFPRPLSAFRTSPSS